MSEDAEEQESAKLAIVDPKNPHKVLRQLVGISVCAEHHEGPLPPPKMLKEYADLFPGADERIFGWTEREMEFRHEMCRQQLANERYGITEDHKTARRGQVFGFILCLLMIGFGGVALLFGQSLAGWGSMSTAIIGIAGAFMWSRKTQKAEEKKPAEKAEEIALAKQENSKP